MPAKIKTIRRVTSDSALYDIQVEQNANYFANGILVHNSTIYNDHYHARSIDTDRHDSRNLLKAWAAQWQYQLDDGMRVCGENAYARHSIVYDDSNPLPHHFLGFSVWIEDRCLSWDETMEYFSILGIASVPVIWRGIYDEEQIKALYDPKKDWDTCEGYVVRLASDFTYRDFRKSVAKYVRPGHVQTAKHHWKSQTVIPNVFT